MNIENLCILTEKIDIVHLDDIQPFVSRFVVIFRTIMQLFEKWTIF